MIIVPAQKLADAVKKHLLPSAIRYVAEQQKEKVSELKEKSS